LTGLSRTLQWADEHQRKGSSGECRLQKLRELAPIVRQRDVRGACMPPIQAPLGLPVPYCEYAHDADRSGKSHGCLASQGRLPRNRRRRYGNLCLRRNGTKGLLGKRGAGRVGSAWLGRTVELEPTDKVPTNTVQESEARHVQ